MAKTDKIK